MLTVEYAPDNGTTVPDNQVRSYVKMIVDSYNAMGNKVFTVTVGSEILISAFRTLVKKGELEMQVKFGEVLIPVDTDGRLTFYPPNYPDVNCDILLELF